MSTETLGAVAIVVAAVWCGLLWRPWAWAAQRSVSAGAGTQGGGLGLNLEFRQVANIAIGAIGAYGVLGAFNIFRIMQLYSVFDWSALMTPEQTIGVVVAIAVASFGGVLVNGHMMLGHLMSERRRDDGPPRAILLLLGAVPISWLALAFIWVHPYTLGVVVDPEFGNDEAWSVASWVWYGAPWVVALAATSMLARGLLWKRSQGEAGPGVSASRSGASESSQGPATGFRGRGSERALAAVKGLAARNELPLSIVLGAAAAYAGVLFLNTFRIMKLYSVWERGDVMPSHEIPVGIAALNLAIWGSVALYGLPRHEEGKDRFLHPVTLQLLGAVFVVWLALAFIWVHPYSIGVVVAGFQFAEDRAWGPADWIMYVVPWVVAGAVTLAFPFVLWADRRGVLERRRT